MLMNSGTSGIHGLNFTLFLSIPPNIFIFAVGKSVKQILVQKSGQDCNITLALYEIS